MSILKKKQKTNEELKNEALSYSVDELKAKAQGAKKMSALKGGLIIALSLCSLLFSYTQFQEAMVCKGICAVDVNESMIKTGWAKGEQQKEETVWVVDYKGNYTQQESILFRMKLDKIAAISKTGDGLIINIESNGGDAIACANDYDRVVKMRTMHGLKVSAVVDRAAHSCGYYLASAATSIYAQKGASVGNIGSAMTMMTNPIQALVKKVTGAEVIVIGSTRAKEIFAGSPLKTKEDHAIVKKYVDAGAKNFFMDVIKGRAGRINPKDYPTVFSAYPFSARHAKQLGLIDGFASISEILQGYHANGYTIKRITINDVAKASKQVFVG